MRTMKRCLASMTLSGRWGSEHLWPGLEVNFERELAPGFTIAAAVAGRENCFEDVESVDDAAADEVAAPSTKPRAKALKE